MKKNYVYAAVLVLMSLLLWFGTYLYVEYHPVKYENGTFVELPENTGEERELSA